MARRGRKSGGGVFGEDAAVLGDAPFMSSEDVGNFFARVPGALIWLGVQRPDKSNGAPLHSPHFVLDPDALVLGSLLHINLALDFLA
jgi:metal-dependent amidase/aminoacylase/carboxypeptidase family protein